MKERVSQQHEQITTELRAAALRRLHEEWHDQNFRLFRSQMRAPQFELTETRRLGAFESHSRTMSLSSELLYAGWYELTEVLKHEMAHQYVFEVLGVQDEAPHGDTFRRVCAEREIDARAAGLPDSASAETDAKSEPLEKIEKLLALAESDNENEARAAMVAARRMMLKYNLEGLGQERRYCHRLIGPARARRESWRKILGAIVSEHFFVDLIIIPSYDPLSGKRLSVLEGAGTRENLDIASYVHDFLESQASALWTKRKQAGAEGRERGSYLYGVMSGFLEKLEAESNRHAQSGLVWAGDPELAQYQSRRHPRLRRVSSRTTVNSEAFSAGQRDGKRIVLRRGVQDNAHPQKPKLLRGR